MPIGYDLFTCNTFVSLERKENKGAFCNVLYIISDDEDIAIAFKRRRPNNLVRTDQGTKQFVTQKCRKI
ncbi:MAG: hypothetical protein N2738_09045 [Thermodesulfovibrionales bacterium]|nr:hypothetical protein [Thermodesulfovibrionales bacterium]